MTVSIQTKLAVNGYEMCHHRITGDESQWKLDDASQYVNCGTSEHAAEDVSAGTVTPRLAITVFPTPEELTVLIPLLGLLEDPGASKIFKSSIAANMYPVPPLFPVKIWYNPSDIDTLVTLPDCMVDKAILRGGKGGMPVSLELQVVGSAAPVIGSGTFTEPHVTANSTSYSFTAATLVADGASHKFQSAVVAVDNKLLIQHNNGVYPSGLTPMDREIWLAVNTPFDSVHVDLWKKSLDPATRAAGYAATLALTRGTKSSTLVFANVKHEGKLPDVIAKTEVRYDFLSRAYSVAGGPSLVWTNDDT